MQHKIDATIPDVQNSADIRGIPINEVGVKSVRHPMIIEDRDQTLHHTVGLFDMYVNLEAHAKGTHMSRFIELLNREPVHLSTSNMLDFAASMGALLGSQTAYYKVRFPFFVLNQAPVTQAASLVDYEVTLEATWCVNQAHHCRVSVLVPVTSLCPCSKDISDYGAHNQRSHVIINAVIAPGSSLWLRDLIDCVESNASCRVYGILKRPDEKYVTERAYDHPGFVEDLVRDVAISLGALKNIRSFSVSSENFESIHNHSAFARLHSEH